MVVIQAPENLGGDPLNMPPATFAVVTMMAVRVLILFGIPVLLVSLPGFLLTRKKIFKIGLFYAIGALIIFIVLQLYKAMFPPELFRY